MAFFSLAFGGYLKLFATGDSGSVCSGNVSLPKSNVTWGFSDFLALIFFSGLMSGCSISAILAFASTLYAPAYLILAVACAVFLYISMVMPIAAGLMAEGSAKWKEKGPFNLGGLSKPNAVLAIIFGITLAISGFFPPNEKVFYFTIVFVVALLGFWSKKTAPVGIAVAVIGLLLGFLPVSDENVLHFLIPDATTSYIAIGVAVVAAVITFMTGGEENRFEGVPEGDKIVERQKMIAEIEKKYGEH